MWQAAREAPRQIAKEFGRVKLGTILEVEVCPECGMRVASKQIGYDDAGWWMIPSALVEVEESTQERKD